MCTHFNKKDLDLIEASNEEFFPSAKRDVLYTALVKDIVKNNRASQVMKCCFFILVCVIFCVICTLGVLSIYNISKKPNITIADMGIAITGFGSVLGSIIVLPQTIAKHLFPENSELARFAFIKDNQQFDLATVLDEKGGIFDDGDEIGAEVEDSEDDEDSNDAEP